MKDNFSAQASLYSKYRPTYPNSVFEFIYKVVPGNDYAWDCATGNGQIAVELSKVFNKVAATDISANQLAGAKQRENIMYLLENAEHSSFPDSSFDLITVGQAIHWLNFDNFYAEVHRTLKPNGIIAVLGYPLMRIDSKVDKVIEYFYNTVLKDYWDDERRFIDQQYQTIPFPFSEIKAPEFLIQLKWDLNGLFGFLNTWSAVQHYMKRNKNNPVDLIADQLKEEWGGEIAKEVTFKLLVRIGKV